MARTILVIDDEDNMRWVLDRALQKAGYEVLTASRGAQGLELFALNRVDLVLLDLKMPGMGGLAVLRELRRRHANVPILLLTAYATVPTAVEALRTGATDYLRKPFDLEAVLAKVNQYIAAQVDRAADEEVTTPTTDFVAFVGAAPALHHPLDVACTAAHTFYTVHIQGEPGSGRRHLARLIHRHSDANAQRLVTINCAALPQSLLRTELLGPASEPDTGGRRRRALGGSLLLANVDVLPAEFVAALVDRLSPYLRTDQRPHGLRLLLTSQQALNDAWRPQVETTIRIELPPLRQRKEDLSLLLAHFASQATWSREARALLEAYDWPGNVAELKRVVQQAVRLAGDEPVQAEHLPTHLQKTDAVIPGRFVLPPEGIDLEEVEQELIRQALTLARGNKTQAARLLGLTRATLLYRLEKYGITGE